MVFFFKQKTAYDVRISDWSSDVCSSDLTAQAPAAEKKPAKAKATPEAKPAIEKAAAKPKAEAKKADETPADAKPKAKKADEAEKAPAAAKPKEIGRAS